MLGAGSMELGAYAIGRTAEGALHVTIGEDVAVPAAPPMGNGPAGCEKFDTTEFLAHAEPALKDGKGIPALVEVDQIKEVLCGRAHAASACTAVCAHAHMRASVRTCARACARRSEKIGCQRSSRRTSPPSQ